MARKFVLIAVVGVLGAAVLVAPGIGAGKLDPGVTSSTIKIGTTYPLTGVASVYATIPKAAAAYYQYYFSNHKINGRKVDYKFVDDQYDPSTALAQTKKLVEEDKIFAIVGALGTAPNLATQKYLNDRKVPQVLIATGDSFWSQPCATLKADGSVKEPVPATCPAIKKKTGHYWTFGGLGTYTGEAKLMAGYLNSKFKSGKIGVLYQNDAYGKPYLAALKKYLGKKGAKVVSAQPYDATSTDVTAQVVKLKGDGADIFYVIALPRQSIGALATMTRIGWKPKAKIVNAVSATTTFLTAAAGAGADIDGVVSSTGGPNPNDPANANLPAVKEYTKVMAQYYPAGNVKDANNYAAMGGAWLTIQLLAKSGNPPTRAGLMDALTHLNMTSPYLFKGYRLHTTPTDRFLYSSAKLTQWHGDKDGIFKPFGNLVTGLEG